MRRLRQQFEVWRIAFFIYRVMRRGSVRDLERLEWSYRTVGRPDIADYIHRRCGNDYAAFVLNRDSLSWRLRDY